jgi:hypothetical protein
MTVLAALLAALVAPAMAADPATHLVISQVYGGGSSNNATYYRDFVEIFNPTSSTISLAGKSVQYGSAANALSSSFALPAFDLAPGQYYLVGGSGSAGTNTTPVPDGNGSLAMSATAGKVALILGTATSTTATPGAANVIDWVAYGAAATPAEGSPAPAPSIANSITRTAACFDDNSNSTEFAVTPVAPRTTASPLAPCGGTTEPSNAAIVASCPASFTVLAGTGGSVGLSASDPDSIVTNASTAAGTNAGITVGAFTPAAADGQAGSGTLNVGASVAAGTYSVVVNFVNNESQSASCTIPVTVQQAPGTQYTIMQLQGSGENSPHPGVQTTEGVITLKLPAGGFYIQDRNGDGDPTTSDALYIYNTTTTYNVGDKIRITGTITDFKPAAATHAYTEMTNVSNITLIATETPITPTNISMPTDLARYESMLVHIANDLIVNDTSTIGDRSELTLASVRRETPSNRYRPGPELQALMAANARDQITLDDKYFTQQPSSPYIAADLTVRVGDTASNLTGVVDYGSIGNSNYGFKFQPLSVPDVVISRTNPRPTSGSFATSNVKVASANVLNFFTTFTNGTSVFSTTTGQTCTVGCRGADNLAEFIRQRDKIVNSLKLIDADVIGLMEIQNNRDVAAGYLADQLNVAYGSTVYAVVPAPPSTGTDAIRVAMIYKPSKVSLVGNAMSDADTVNDRAPMAQTFKASNGGKFSLIVNHLKSKGGCSASSGAGNTDTGDGQSCFNARRLLQANRLISYFIPAVKAAAGDDDVLLIGDFNAYGMEDPINLLTTTGNLVNQLERYIRPVGTPYSYVFDGQSGYLDHALATASLSPQVTGAGEFHNNADEPDFIDYNLNSSSTPKNQDLYVNNAYRASDHDPVTISLNLVGSTIDVTASFSVQRSALVSNRTTQVTGSVAITNTSGAPVTGPLQVEFTNLPAGVTLVNATGTHNGVPYITVSASSIAAGATSTISLVFNNPTKGAIPYIPVISSGTF